MGTAQVARYCYKNGMSVSWLCNLRERECYFFRSGKIIMLDRGYDLLCSSLVGQKCIPEISRVDFKQVCGSDSWSCSCCCSSFSAKHLHRSPSVCNCSVFSDSWWFQSSCIEYLIKATFVTAPGTRSSLKCIPNAFSTVTALPDLSCCAQYCRYWLSVLALAARLTFVTFLTFVAFLWWEKVWNQLGLFDIPSL